MSQPQTECKLRNGFVGSLIGGVVLGSIVGTLLGYLVGKKTSQGKLPELDLRDMPDRLRELSDAVASRFKS
ncbi:MAG TPA: hypothetical protein VGK19_09020 [Capsulimonadaceae bacterium]